MQTFDPSAVELDHDFQQHQRQFAGDDKLFVQFYQHYVKDDDASAEKGRPIYKDATFVKIITPGNRDNIVDRPTTDFDKMRFRERFMRFQKGEEAIGDGTRLDEWPLISRSMVEEMRYLGFYTVEQVAEANEAALHKVAGLTELSRRARNWLAATKDTEAAAKLLKESGEKDARIAALEAQIADLAKRLPPVAAGMTDLANAKADSTGGATSGQMSES